MTKVFLGSNLKNLTNGVEELEVEATSIKSLIGARARQIIRCPYRCLSALILSSQSNAYHLIYSNKEQIPIYLFDKRLYYYGRNNSSVILNMIILLSELFGGINGGIFTYSKIFIL